MKKNIVRVIGYGLLVIGLAGCGYTTRSLISNTYKTIYITPFANKIDITRETDANRRYKVYRPLLENDITKAAIDRFVIDGNLRVVSSDNSDLVLKGALINYQRDAVRYTNNNEVEEYRVTIIVELSLYDKEKKLLWQENSFAANASYFVSGSNANTEASAISKAAEDLARRIVERVVEEW